MADHNDALAQLAAVKAELDTTRSQVQEVEGLMDTLEHSFQAFLQEVEQLVHQEDAKLQDAQHHATQMGPRSWRPAWALEAIHGAGNHGNPARDRIN